MYKWYFCFRRAKAYTVAGRRSITVAGISMLFAYTVFLSSIQALLTTKPNAEHLISASAAMVTQKGKGLWCRVFSTPCN